VHQIRFRPGLRPELRWAGGGAYSALPDPLAGLRCLLLRAGEGKGRERSGGKEEDEVGEGRGTGGMEGRDVSEREGRGRREREEGREEKQGKRKGGEGGRRKKSKNTPHRQFLPTPLGRAGVAWATSSCNVFTNAT